MFNISSTLSALFKLILREVKQVASKTWLYKAVFYQTNKMEAQVNCQKCKYIIHLKDRFRLHDPDNERFHVPRYFYRYERCYNCDEGYKIEYFTTAGILSGAQGYNYQMGETT